MSPLRTSVPDELLRLLPLTATVFYILFALAEGGKHGYAIMRQTKQYSGGSFKMGPGTLYTTIQRLLDLALIEEFSEPETKDDKDTRRRYYRLTGYGRKLLELDLARMRSAVRIAQDFDLASEG